MQSAAEHGIEMIDLVVVNLYPFESTVAQPDTTYKLAIENIDIGGPSMLRSAAKNHASVSVIVDASDYATFLRILSEGDADALARLRKHLALKVFQRTATYDSAIAQYLAEQEEEGADEPNLDHISDIPENLELL